MLTCIFLGFTGIGNLLRQSYASIFILSAFFYEGRKKYGLLIIASLFHFSSPLIYLFIKWLSLAKLRQFLLSVFFLLFTYFVAWKYLYPLLEQVHFLKLTAYLSKSNKGLELSTIIGAYKEIALFGIVGFLYYLLGLSKNLAPLYFSALFISVVVFLENLLPGVSLRFNHAVISFCVGPLMYYILTRTKDAKILAVGLIVPILFILKISSFVNNPNDMALFDDNKLYYSQPFEYINFLDEEISNDKRDWKKMKYQ